MPEILTYSGGKYFAIPHLLPFVPPGTTHMVSSFLGAGHFELHLEAKGVRVYGSDIYKALISCWHQVMKDPNRVADLVEWYVPLIDRDFYYRVAACLEHISPLEDQAAWFLIVNRCSYAAMGADGGYSHARHRDFLERLPGFMKAIREFKTTNFFIDCCDFEESLKRHPNTFAYLDPPYDLASGFTLYGLRGRNFPHSRLAEILSKRESEWMLSYHKTDRILNLYKHFRIVDLSGLWWYRMKSKNSHEILIVSDGLELPDSVRLINPISTTKFSIPNNSCVRPPRTESEPIQKADDRLAKS
jgi:site-specific DNA-adenine methylase